MSRTLKTQDVINLLKKQVGIDGSQEQVAFSLGVSPQYLSDVLNGRREPGKKIYEAMGLERVVMFVKKEI
jgi:transcriptional regulator with XRE-family HTH domain